MTRMPGHLNPIPRTLGRPTGRPARQTPGPCLSPPWRMDDIGWFSQHHVSMLPVSRASASWPPHQGGHVHNTWCLSTRNLSTVTRLPRLRLQDVSGTWSMQSALKNSSFNVTRLIVKAQTFANLPVFAAAWLALAYSCGAQTWIGL